MIYIYVYMRIKEDRRPHSSTENHFSITEYVVEILVERERWNNQPNIYR